MSWGRRESDYQGLMRWRRNLFIQITHATYSHALISVTSKMIVIHYGVWSGKEFTPLHTERYQLIPGLFDGHGWNLQNVMKFLEKSPQGFRTPGGGNGVYRVDTIDLSEYTAFGSYAPLYTEPKRALMELPKGRIIREVLEACAEHANPLGMYYAGIRRLMEVACYGFGSVKHALEVLGAMDYLRMHVTYNPLKMRDEVIYQLSPWVLYVSSDHIERAIQLWNQASSYSNERFNAQPESESRIRTRTEPDSLNQNQNQNQNQNPPSKSETPKTTHPDLPPEEQPESQDGKDHEPTPETAQRGAQNSEQSSPQTQQGRRPQAPAKQSSVPPPRNVPLEKCYEALPHADQELFAQTLAGAGTSPQQARQLILSYGHERVATVWTNIQAQKAAGKTILKPVGMLVAALKRGQYTQLPDGKDNPNPEDRYTGGNYADLFNKNSSEV